MDKVLPNDDRQAITHRLSGVRNRGRAPAPASLSLGKALGTALVVALAVGACGGPTGVGVGAPLPTASSAQGKAAGQAAGQGAGQRSGQGSGQGRGQGAGTAAGRDGVRTGPGVTADAITLGVLTDLTGPYATAGRAVLNAANLYFGQVNAAGGICGRQVRLVVRDHGYDVDKAVAAYTELEPQVLGFEHLLGAPMTAALQTNIQSDRVLTAPASWASSLLTNPYIAVMGTTYDVETVNAFDYLSRRADLHRGDVVAHVYADDEYGRNAVQGSRAAAARLGVTLREVPVKAADDDLSAEIAALVPARVRAVVLSTSPRQTASAVGTAATVGLTAPFVGNSPTFTGALLATPAGPALRSRFTLVGSSAPPGAGRPEVVKVVKAYRAAYPQSPVDASVIYGYGAASAYAEVLRRACTARDLTRVGLSTAFRQTRDLDTGGLLAPLDFSRPGASPARAVAASRPDPTVVGGLRLVEWFFASAAAREYKTPSES